MTKRSSTPPVTLQQKDEFCAAISLGCDRETARKFQGWTQEQLSLAIDNDPKFHQKLQRAEATAELTHVRNLNSAAAEPKNWRVSVWWLERRWPQRYGKRHIRVLKEKEILKGSSSTTPKRFFHPQSRAKIAQTKSAGKQRQSLPR